MILIDPGGQVEQVARDLLSLADSPYHVQTNTDNGLMFAVPEYLADRYSAAADDVRIEPAAPKRRGRPRKERA